MTAGPPGPVDDFGADVQLRAVRARVEEAIGYVPNLYRTLAHAPTLLAGWIDFAWSLRNDAAADRATRELLIMRQAQLHGADYEWRHHWEMAVAAGVPEDKLLALSGWATSDRYSEAERAVLRMADELSSHGAITDGTWEALGRHFPDRELVELVVTAAFYTCVSQILGGLRVALEDRYADVPAVPPPRVGP